MKKVVSIFLAALMMTVVLTGCGGKTKKEPAVADVLAAVKASQTLPEMADITDLETIQTMYDFATEDIDQAVMTRAGTGQNADEIIVVKMAKDVKSEKIQTALEARLALVNELFSNYTPDDKPKIDGAVTAVQDSYLMLAVCADGEAAKAAFSKAFE